MASVDIESALIKNLIADNKAIIDEDTRGFWEAFAKIWVPLVPEIHAIVAKTPESEKYENWDWLLFTRAVGALAENYNPGSGHQVDDEAKKLAQAIGYNELEIRQNLYALDFKFYADLANVLFYDLESLEALTAKAE